MSSYDLSNKVALVTGASRGIGRQIAISLAANGAKVIVNYCGSQAKAEETVQIIKENGGNAVAMCFNVANLAETEQTISKIIEEYGKVDILVNNAGITRDNLLIKMSEEDFDMVLDTNLKGAFNTIKCLYRNFLKLRGGRIINISSVSGVMGNAGQANYSASKAGIIGLTKSVAKELGARNAATAAISSVRPSLPSGITFFAPSKTDSGSFSVISVSMNPGAIAFTHTPLAPSSFATLLVRPIIPAFDAE